MRRLCVRGFSVAALIALPVAPAMAQDIHLLETLVRQQAETIERQQAQIDALERRLAALEESGETAAPDQAASNSQTDLGAARSAQAATAQDGRSGDADQPMARRPRPALTRFPDAAIVQADDFDGSINLGGSGLLARIGGYAQINLTYDREPAGLDDLFVAASIPADALDAQRFEAFAGYSRLNLDVRGDSRFGPFRAFIEGDFAGDGGNPITTNGSGFRLRHAFGQLGPFYAGQYWSLFSDIESYAETLDLTVPAGKSTVRQAAARLNLDVAEGLTAAFSVENPRGAIGAVPDGAEIENTAPDLLAGLAYEADFGRISAVGLARRLAVAGPSGGADAWGWGVNLTGRVMLPFLGEMDNLTYGLVGGRGVGRYIVELSGDDLDAALRPDGSLDPIAAAGGQIGLQHFWSETLRSTATFGIVRVLDDDLSPETIDRALSGSLNLLWSPIERTTFGIEALYGERRDQDSATRDARRFLAVGRFEF